jgi:hypothetical protein
MPNGVATFMLGERAEQMMFAGNAQQSEQRRTQERMTLGCLAGKGQAE